MISSGGRAKVGALPWPRLKGQGLGELVQRQTGAGGAGEGRAQLARQARLEPRKRPLMERVEYVLGGRTSTMEGDGRMARPDGREDERLSAH